MYLPTSDLKDAWDTDSGIGSLDVERKRVPRFTEEAFKPHDDCRFRVTVSPCSDCRAYCHPCQADVLDLDSGCSANHISVLRCSAEWKCEFFWAWVKINRAVSDKGKLVAVPQDLAGQGGQPLDGDNAISINEAGHRTILFTPEFKNGAFRKAKKKAPETNPKTGRKTTSGRVREILTLAHELQLPEEAILAEMLSSPVLSSVKKGKLHSRLSEILRRLQLVANVRKLGSIGGRRPKSMRKRKEEIQEPNLELDRLLDFGFGDNIKKKRTREKEGKREKLDQDLDALSMMDLDSADPSKEL